MPSKAHEPVLGTRPLALRPYQPHKRKRTLPLVNAGGELPSVITAERARAVLREAMAPKQGEGRRGS
jgi:hypothetical protein